MYMSIFSVAIFSIMVTGLTAYAEIKEKLDLNEYKLTFSEDFNELKVSAWGPIEPGKARWIAHTPWGGDFGDAFFAEPTPGFPFTVQNGVLRIAARKFPDGRWGSGLLSSTDPNGNGFLQKFGYFEARAKLPAGPGLWPAFWLVANQDPETSAEIDVLEHYGVAPDKYESVVHVWPKKKERKKYGALLRHDVPPGSLYEDFHNYGVAIDAKWIIFYLDRVEMGRTPTPPEHHRPMFMLINLALGSGWPIDKTPSPSYMHVDYIRAYAKK